MLSLVNGFHLSIVNLSNTRMHRIPFTDFCAYLYILIYKGEVWYNHWCFLLLKRAGVAFHNFFLQNFMVFNI